MVNAQRSVAPTIPLCQLRLRFCLRPLGVIFRWCATTIIWDKFKSYEVASIISLLLLLVSVAFFTLIERKVLGYIILRRGPSKPSLSGLLVPFADALKLLAKPFLITTASSPILTRFSCFLLFFIPSLLWVFVQTSSPIWN